MCEVIAPVKTIITIGKKSNNEPATVILEDLPHLFISWTEPEPLTVFFQDILSQLIVKQKAGILDLAICARDQTISSFSSRDGILDNAIMLLRSAEGELTGTRPGFINRLRKEWLRRKKTTVKPGQPPAYQKPLIILVDDLIDLIITRNRNTGLYFLELLRYGSAQKIHFLMGSTRSYRGLVRQLLQFEKKGEPPLLDTSMPELVITPEGLFFYKRPEELNYTRLFGIHEGE